MQTQQKWKHETVRGQTKQNQTTTSKQANEQISERTNERTNKQTNTTPSNSPKKNHGPDDDGRLSGARGECKHLRVERIARLFGARGGVPYPQRLIEAARQHDLLAVVDADVDAARRLAVPRERPRHAPRRQVDHVNVAVEGTRVRQSIIT